MTYISGVLYYVSTTINPILYQIMSLKFREAFKDTIARCCGFRSFKGSRSRRTYSILSRSAQRPLGANGGTNPDSTDYSGNSVREESVPSSCRSGLKNDSSSDTISRMQTPHKSHPESTLGLNSAGNEVDSRAFSVIISTKKGKVTTIRTTTVPTVDSNERVSFAVPLTSMSPKAKWSKLKNKDNCNLWRVLGCLDTNTTVQQQHSPYSTPIPEPNLSLVPSGETFAMLPVSGSNQSLSNVSNSSLRDIEKGALEDELTLYMQELQRREQC